MMLVQSRKQKSQENTGKEEEVQQAYREVNRQTPGKKRKQVLLVQ